MAEDARRAVLDEATLRRLYDPVRGATLRALLLSHGALAAAFAIALWTRSWGGWAVAFVIAVAVQTRLAMVMHEGAHFLVHSRKDVNDRITDWLAAFPIAMTVETYRQNHLPHHSRLGTPDDPDFTALCAPPLETGVGASVLAAVSGRRYLQLLRKYVGRGGAARAPATSGSVLGRGLWQGGLLAVAVAGGDPLAYFAIWFLPLVTFGVLINELRSIIEHTPLIDRPPPGTAVPLEPIARTVRAGWVARVWFAPLNFHYHHEHHLYPGVPFSRLPELHAALATRGYYAANPHLLCNGYIGILRTLWARYRPAPPAVSLDTANGFYVARGV